MTTIRVERYHDISCGHRVVGHESKCRHLHGHNYRITFVCEGALDSLGRVIDFGEVKSKLCMWLEDNWDHKFLAWENDSLMSGIVASCVNAGSKMTDPDYGMLYGSIVWLPFNPTAENLGAYLLKVVGPNQLVGTGIELVEVRVEETRKCSAVVKRGM